MDKDEKKPKRNKDKEQKSLDEMLKEAEEEIEKLIKEAGITEDDRSEVKVVRIGKPKLPKHLSIIRYIILGFADIILTLAISGYVNWYSFTGNLIIGIVLFCLIFTIVDILLKKIVSKVFPQAVFYSFGSINLLLSLIAVWVGVTLIPNFKVTSQSSLTIYLVMFFVARFIVSDVVFKLIIGSSLKNIRRKRL